MSISVDEAIGTLSVMFESYDKDTLIAVLEANDGHLERTIDTLLAMQSDNELAAAEAQGITSATTLPPPAPSSPRVNVPARQSTRVSLPDDFLRVPGTVTDQEMQDRMLAEMLQNELFRQEINADRDLTSYIGTDGRRRRSSVEEKSAMEVANEAMTAVGEKLSYMSGAVKGKISQMYTRFQHARNGTDPSHRPLMALSDDEDDRRQELPARDDETLRRRQGSKESPRAAGTSSSRHSFGHSKND
ncbi:Aste57867_22505 [Aphanomyces stellatus]|uniref:Aste57867_22505 protein n=1 Tax=Aphanomyces stellatus TaxID=120398 RepID=A0A485LM42_9STRA|nr:hypothetical protein As57867_022435 [Aphanomyces stellatus]VFT99165.1 Aste57867_22505 [Aphanomyces stellatus]